jgi:hypothetical protein
MIKCSLFSIVLPPISLARLRQERTRKKQNSTPYSRYPQVDLVFASSPQKISNALLSLPAAVGEWSRRDASDIDGLSREAEPSGS